MASLHYLRFLATLAAASTEILNHLVWEAHISPQRTYLGPEYSRNQIARYKVHVQDIEEDKSRTSAFLLKLINRIPIDRFVLVLISISEDTLRGMTKPEFEHLAIDWIIRYTQVLPRRSEFVSPSVNLFFEDFETCEGQQFQFKQSSAVWNPAVDAPSSFQPSHTPPSCPAGWIPRHVWR